MSIKTAPLKQRRNDMDSIIKRLNNGQNFIITSHVNPDGDNIGSSIAMTRFLRAMGKNAIHVLEDSVPENLSFLLEDYEIIGKASDIPQDFLAGEYDLIVLDSAQKNRVALPSGIADKAQKVLNIDHHISNTGFGDINYVCSDIGSSSEVVCNIIRAINESRIDSAIATALYTGISTDTGNFMFPSVTPNTFYTAAFLTQKGADRNKIANEVYRNISQSFRLLTKMALDTFQVRNSVGIMVMSLKMLEESGVDYKDTDLLANVAVDTRGVEVGILVKERENKTYKISLRSKARVNVCEIAQQFDGGGHFHAAGCTIFGTAEEVIERLQLAAENQIKKDLSDD